MNLQSSATATTVTATATAVQPKLLTTTTTNTTTTKMQHARHGCESIFKKSVLENRRKEGKVVLSIYRMETFFSLPYYLICTAVIIADIARL